MSTELWREQNQEKLRQYRRDYYQRNKEREKARITKTNKIRKALIREWLDDFKSKRKCLRCDENHIGCLEFHHRDPSTKEIDISFAVRAGWSIEKISQEIEKCDILCANCHRKLHWEQRNTGAWCSGNMSVSKTEDASSILAAPAC